MQRYNHPESIYLAYILDLTPPPIYFVEGGLDRADLHLFTIIVVIDDMISVLPTVKVLFIAGHVSLTGLLYGLDTGMPRQRSPFSPSELYRKASLSSFLYGWARLVL